MLSYALISLMAPANSDRVFCENNKDSKGSVGKIQAVLCGYYGKGNGGDEALLASYYKCYRLMSHRPVLSGNPEQTRDRYGVETCDRQTFLPVLQALRQSDVLIWVAAAMQDATSAASPFTMGGLMALTSR